MKIEPNDSSAQSRLANYPVNEIEGRLPSICRDARHAPPTKRNGVAISGSRATMDMPVAVYVISVTPSVEANLRMVVDGAALRTRSK